MFWNSFITRDPSLVREFLSPEINLLVLQRPEMDLSAFKSCLDKEFEHSQAVDSIADLDGFSKSLKKDLNEETLDAVMAEIRLVYGYYSEVSETDSAVVRLSCGPDWTIFQTHQCPLMLRVVYHPKPIEWARNRDVQWQWFGRLGALLHKSKTNDDYNWSLIGGLSNSRGFVTRCYQPLPIRIEKKSSGNIVPIRLLSKYQLLVRMIFVLVERAYKTKLKLNNRERTLCMMNAGAARKAYNWALDRINQGISKPNAMALHKEINLWKKEPGHEWAYEVSKCSFQEALRDLQRAFTNHRKNPGHFGRPKFKKRSKAIGGFRLTGKIRVWSDRVQLPMLGVLRLWEKDYIPQDKHILSATVSEECGDWYVSILVREEIRPLETTDEVLGVDLGINSLAVCSDGAVYENPKEYRKKQKKLKRLQRKHSSRVKGSNRKKEARRRLARQYRKVRRARNDRIHKMTSEVVKTKRPGMIVLEDLNVSGMAKNHYLAAAILDASFGEIRRQLGYKAKWYGSEVMIADRWYASSKLCSCCGSKRESLPLSERVFRCPECGLVLDRDLNASCNLRSYGLEYRKSCGNLRARRLEVATAQAVVPVVESRMDAALTDAALVVSVKER